MWAVEPNSALPDNGLDDPLLNRGGGNGDEEGTPRLMRETSQPGSDVDSVSEDEDEPTTTTPSKSMGRAKRPRAALRYYEDVSVKNEHAAGKEAGGKRANRNCCFLCGGWSHYAGSCPNDRCLICLQTGHQSRDCPSDRRIGVCSACGRVGHSRRECPLLDEPEVSDCRCVACGEYGHLDCTPFERRPKRASCFNCGSMGHEANDCARDGPDRWQRLFVQSLGSSMSRTPGSWGSSGGQGRGALSSQRGPPPSSGRSLHQLMTRHPEGDGGKGSSKGKGSSSRKGSGIGKGGSGGKGDGSRSKGHSHTRWT